MGIANYRRSSMPALGLGCCDPSQGYSSNSPLFFWSADLRPRVQAGSSLTRRSQRHVFLIAFRPYLLDSLHDWHLTILLVAAIIIHLAHIFFQGLQINHSVVVFG